MPYQFVLPTMESVHKDLTTNPPGQGMMGMDVSTAFNMSFNVVYLMVLHERAQMSKRKRRRQPDVPTRMKQIIAELHTEYFAIEAAKKEAA